MNLAARNSSGNKEMKLKIFKIVHNDPPITILVSKQFDFFKNEKYWLFLALRWVQRDE